MPFGILCLNRRSYAKDLCESESVKAVYQRPQGMVMMTSQDDNVNILYRFTSDHAVAVAVAVNLPPIDQ